VRTYRWLTLSLTCAIALFAFAASAQAGWHHRHDRTRLDPGNLLLSGSVYSPADTQPGVTQLPLDCTPGNCVTAQFDGAYPYVFNNAPIDASFGVTSKIDLWQLTPWGQPIDTIRVPSSQIVTSFSSKSELALNLSTDGQDVTFMGYDARPSQIDVSNSNTPLVIDPTNPVPQAYYRVVATLDRWGHFSYTLTNAYSGNNGRAAVLDNYNDELYTAGNAGNGSNPQPSGIVLGAGAQIISPSPQGEDVQTPGLPTPVGNFNVTELGDSADKIGKDDNFRGLTLYHNVLYYTKGSGGNGVDTVYFLDTTGKACPNGVGLPAANAAAPTASFSFSVTTGEPTNMCILKGFNTKLTKKSTDFPFGLWFANPHTLYVADEGSGDSTYSAATGQYTNATGSAQPGAGLEKWVFNSSAQSWQLAYTLQSGLGLGQPYTVPGYPTGNNSGVTPAAPWAPATDGLRNLTGRVNRDGSVTIWAITSTVSGNGDQGADPNKLVEITDWPSATTSPGAHESFHTVRTAGYAEVLRGVSFTPGTDNR
jgi:hypothetical protein